MLAVAALLGLIVDVIRFVLGLVLDLILDLVETQETFKCGGTLVRGTAGKLNASMSQRTSWTWPWTRQLKVNTQQAHLLPKVLPSLYHGLSSSNISAARACAFLSLIPVRMRCFFSCATHLARFSRSSLVMSGAGSACRGPKRKPTPPTVETATALAHVGVDAAAGFAAIIRLAAGTVRRLALDEARSAAAGGTGMDTAATASVVARGERQRGVGT